MQNFLGIILSFVFVVVIMLIGRLFEKFGKEMSRKFIHIVLAFWWLIAMYFFKDVIWASVVPICFVIINYLSYKKDIIKVMEREKQDGPGTVYYAISLFVVVLITYGFMKRPELGIAPIFIMGFGDGLASVVGTKIKSYAYKVGDTKKTIAGSLTMFIVSLVILCIFFGMLHLNLWWLKASILAIVLTLVEAISIKGRDNLTVPILACILICVLV